MGLYLAEVFNIIYLGSEEIKPERQLGTIKVDDDNLCHYLYEVNHVDTSRPSIQPGDELILTAPNVQSISSIGPLVIDIDLFCGDYKGSINYEYFPSGRNMHKKPLEKRIISKDGTGEIQILYALYDNSMEAHLKIELLTKDNSAATNLHGVIAGSNSDIDRPAYSSMLFLKKPCHGINVGHGELIPLSRSVIAVPCKSVLFLDFHLLTDNDEMVQGYVEFDANPGAETVKRLVGTKGDVVANVTWFISPSCKDL